MAHLVFDVFSGDPHLVFVEDGDHAVHGASGGAFVEVLLCGRDELYAKFFKRHHHDGVVPIAGEAGKGVDDDVADVAVGLEVGDHLPEGGAVLDRLRGFAGVGELVDDDSVEFLRSRDDGFTLGGQRDALRVEVRLDLAKR
ncbi:MAG TPA: hypothetical protein VN748_18465 [Pseudonocardiaceae bacterium]|nr:hypothetical protein [Pseudonocardiaceae bacterium]